ncbi:MAG TPA: AraC family transcriptional regulator [Burkholderiaceae bacterium]|nr:AraC family transcriptional regulator [Burkholderiaceae bacterium]
MDALSAGLRGFRISGAVFIDAHLTAPWAVVTPASADIADIIATEAAHVIPYHLVTDGECFVRIRGSGSVHLASGDIAMFPHGDTLVLESSPDTRPIALSRGFVEDVLKRSTVLPIRHGGGGRTTRMLCGYFAMDRWCGEHLVRGLPPVLCAHVGSEGGQQLLAVLARRSIEETVSSGPGSNAVICRLSEVLFVDALRLVIARDDAPLTGWLAGLRDPAIRQALSGIHARPEHAWDIQSLSKSCGMSRTKFIERFSSLVGSPPMKYLAQWRMVLAARDLREHDATIMQIADRCGYGSEASFTKAFRKAFDVPPATFRRLARGGAGEARLGPGSRSAS